VPEMWMQPKQRNCRYKQDGMLLIARYWLCKDKQGSNADRFPSPGAPPGEVEHNQRLIETGITMAAEAGAHLVLTPELATTGYGFSDRIGTDWIATQPDAWYAVFAIWPVATELPFSLAMWSEMKLKAPCTIAYSRSPPLESCWVGTGR